MFYFGCDYARAGRELSSKLYIDGKNFRRFIFMVKFLCCNDKVGVASQNPNATPFNGLEQCFKFHRNDGHRFENYRHSKPVKLGELNSG